MSNSGPALNVFDYGDFRTYLNDWFAAKKEANPRYSHRLFARRVGSSNPSLLVNITSGRRNLTPDLVDAFVSALGLEDDAATYFRLLVRFGQATDAEDRERAWGGITELRSRLRDPEVDSSRFLYLSDRIYPAIVALAQCAGFRPDPAWVAAQLRPPIPVERAEEALGFLQRIGFLVPEGDTLVPAEPVLHTTPNVALLGSYGYHKQTHDLAGALMERLWEQGSGVAAETAFLGLTVAVPEERLGELRRLLWEAQVQVAHQARAWQDESDRVVQVTIQMYPVSARTT
ncbi:MAG: TIGR02147 family protein [Myxococcota bacterium]